MPGGVTAVSPGESAGMRMDTRSMRARQLAGLLRDWVMPGKAIAQWTHFVTSTCNAHCAHCFYPINQKKNELSLEEIRRLVAALPPIRLLLISGGEPFLRRDLPEIIQLYFEGCGFFSVSVPTNGFNASRIAAEVERICAISPALQLGVAVSIDGFAELHNRIRAVPGLYEKALDTLGTLIELSRRRANLTVSVNTVLMRDNQDEIEAFCAFIHDRFRPTYHSLALIRGNPLDPSQKMNLDIGLYLRLSEWLDARYPPGERRDGWRGVRSRARREVNRRRYAYIARQASGGPFEGFCLAGEREFVLSETGDVFGCEIIGDKLGNVRDVGFDFSRIAAGEAARQFVTAKRQRLCRCTHECNARTMIFFDRGNALPVLGAALGFRRLRS